jgi:hypothetical protein
MKKWIIIDNEMLQGGFWERFPGLSCKMIYNENRNTKKENAALISSAPELLEACQYALDNLAAASRDNLITAPKWFHVQLSETKLMLDSAIQKANGGK